MEGSSYEGFLGFSVDYVRFSLISNLMQNKTKTNATLNLKGQKIKKQPRNQLQTCLESAPSKRAKPINQHLGLPRINTKLLKENLK